MKAKRANRVTAWALLTVAVLISAASSVFDLYETFWWFDEALHCYFTFAITLVLALYSYGALLTGRRRHEILLILTLAGLGIALGVLWEMVEWVYDLLTPSNSILGKTDTMIDLTMDMIGGVLSGIVSVRMLARGRSA